MQLQGQIDDYEEFKLWKSSRLNTSASSAPSTPAPSAPPPSMNREEIARQHQQTEQERIARQQQATKELAERLKPSTLETEHETTEDFDFSMV
jgi:hypothetical protein